MSGNSPFYSGGLRFACVRCSACCRYEPGYVFLSKKDLERLLHAMNMKNGEFTETYCRWIPQAGGAFQLSLKEKANYDCIFWAEDGCSVYEARPLQCRAFPFWQSIVGSRKSWKAAAEDCPGINRGSLNAPETIKKWLAARQNEPIISRSAASKGCYASDGCAKNTGEKF